MCKIKHMGECESMWNVLISGFCRAILNYLVIHSNRNKFCLMLSNTFDCRSGNIVLFEWRVREHFLFRSIRLLFLVPQDTQWLCRALSVTNVFVWETGGVPSHRKICICVCMCAHVCVSVFAMDGIWGYSVFFYLACRTVCVTERERNRGNVCTVAGCSLSLFFGLLPWGDSMRVCY